MRPIVKIMVCGVALLAIAAELVLGGSPASWKPALMQGTAASSLSELAGHAQRAAWVAAVLRRPVFAAGRRPQRATSLAHDAIAAPVLVLVGTVIAPGRRTAIFADPGHVNPISVAQGGHVGPFSLAFVLPGAVWVRGPDGMQQFHVGIGGAGAVHLPVSPLLHTQGGNEQQPE